MTREEMANTIENLPNYRQLWFIRELAKQLRNYQAQTHVETYALEEIMEAAISEAQS